MSREATLYTVGVDEFGQPQPMNQFYCDKMSQEEYELQGSIETEKAIEDLISHLEKDPAAFKKLLRKRKQEDIDNAGLFSYLKARLLQSLQGASYRGDHVTDSEVEAKLDDLKTGMLMAYSYSQENKGRTRFSRRLAMRRCKENTPSPTKRSPRKSPGRGKSPGRKSPGRKSPARGRSPGRRRGIPAAPPPPPPPPQGISNPPPPPPCAPPNLMPTEEGDCLPSTPKTERRILQKTESVLSIQQELLASNPLDRLRTTKNCRSPGGTPLKRRNLLGSTDSLNDDNLLDSSEPLSRAFMRFMEQKFRNVRSPSPATALSNTNSPDCRSPSGFTP